ncbi:hypothetical protein GCM10010217_44220 [Streptomyces tubercidicus]
MDDGVDAVSVQDTGEGQAAETGSDDGDARDAAHDSAFSECGGKRSGGGRAQGIPDRPRDRYSAS